MKSKRVSETAEAAVAKKSVLREAEMQWLDENKDTVSKYAGEWIAVEGTRLVFHSSSFAEVLAETKGEGISIPFILLHTEVIGEPNDGPVVPCIDWNSSTG